MNYLSRIKCTSRMLDSGLRIFCHLPRESLLQRIAPRAALFSRNFHGRHKKRRETGLVRFEKFDNDILVKLPPLLRFMLDRRILFSSYINDRKHPTKHQERYKLALYHFMEEVQRIHQEKTSEHDKESDMVRERKYLDFIHPKNKFRYENLNVGKKESALKKDIKDVFGTADSSIPASKVPCGGCGAFLHCQNVAQPGFKTSETFVEKSEVELQDSLCQRCHLLRHYGYLLEVDVEPTSYMPMLQEVMKPSSLVLLLVDLTDAPCSMHPSIMELISKKQPVIVVGTKLDLLPEDSLYCYSKVKEALKKVVKSTALGSANIIDTCLVSFNSGEGEVELMEAIQAQLDKERTFYNRVSDVFIMGSTNVGKSTLFNRLQQSVLCDTDHKPRQPATASMFPGTTLQLLKYRIKDSQRRKLEQFPPKKIVSSNDDSQQAAPGKGSGDTTEAGSQQAVPGECSGDTGGDTSETNSHLVNCANSGGDTTQNSLQVEETWLYDTPGVLQPDQLVPLLSPDELPLVLSRQTLIPETFQLKEGQSLLVAGLARLDLLHLYHSASSDMAIGPYNYVDVTVFRSEYLPVTIVWTCDAPAVYREYLGSKLLRVPCGETQRLQHWPPLQPNDLRFSGVKEEAISSADVVLSNAGWLAVRLFPKSTCEVRAWTPNGRGAYLRRQPFLPNAVLRRGPKERFSPRYGDHKLWVYDFELDKTRYMTPDLEKQLKISSEAPDPRKAHFIE